MALLAMTPVVASVLPQASVSADTAKNSQALQSKVQGISGFWSGVPTGSQLLSLGTVDSDKLAGVSVDTMIFPLNGFNEGNAAFEVYNVTTGKTVSETITTNPIGEMATYKLPVTDAKVGDELALRFWGVTGMCGGSFIVSGYNA
ncbi:hypothetical protein OGZ51_06430 [Lactococcus lactis]|uniref:Uncharacterized protein n=1 Tax=Lactococcus lactis TaxID=1358 RepID=A0A9X4S4Z4_9LACT|nr:hypothetical protein [Lactococcus lactis]MDG4983782.1 hypothetical protein [Lactococcus lactis]